MNGPRPNDPELDALLGAYALDALEPEERARVEEYVEHNAAAQAEVDELRETAASLALVPSVGTDVAAPPELWTRLAVAVQAEPKVDELAVQRERRSRRGVRAGVLVAVAAAVVAVIALQVAVLTGRDHNGQSVAAAFAKAVKTDGARQVTLTANGSDVGRIVVLTDGTGYMKNDGMKALSSDQTYQLWALTGDQAKPTAISAGVLGPDPGTIGFHVDGSVLGFAVSVEQSGGAVQPSTPVASATLSA